MGEFCEFDIDFEQFDDLRAVVVHDECGAHEDVWFYRLDGLKAENSKLRGLVRDLWKACPADDYYCIYHCEHYDKESESHCKLKDRMRELGVEVDA